MNEELEVYIEEYRKLKKNREIINSIDSDFFFDFADTMLNYIENSIPKKKVEELKEEITLPNIIVDERRNCKTLEYGKKLGKLEVLQELLEGK